MSAERIVSEIDVRHLEAIRANVRSFMRKAGRLAEEVKKEGGLLLDIAPQVHEGARPFFPANVRIETLDIDPSSGATHIADLCKTNSELTAGTYDFVVCTEVLEHCLQPFHAVAEILRLLAPGGYVFTSTPFDFRIHGPLPDCWRFTEHGLRALFQDFEILSLEALETEDRFLMPVHYTLVARKPA